jgi:indole-3-glycerol phosphate synthase
MEPLVEVHTQEELEAALKTDAKIIGINNRNLNTLEIDLGTFERLAMRAKEAGVFLVAESGVHNMEDALRMIRAGADALLVGTELMNDPKRLGEINRI